MPTNDTARLRTLQMLAALSAAVAATCPTAAMAANPPNCSAWSSSVAYTAGAVVIDQGKTYTANWWTQGNEPVTNNGGAGSGQPWTLSSGCSSPTPSPTPAPTPSPTPSPTPAPTPSPTPAPPPAGSVFYGPYKDITVSMNWNTNVISTAVTGTLSPVLSVKPAKLREITWAFATGACGSENWGGLSASAVAAANVQNFVSAGTKYVISTGGAAGSFTCASDADFETFVNRYASSSLAGIDFDIEAGQSSADIDNLVTRVKNSQSKHPGLRWSFTLATLGGNSPQSLGSMGVTVMASIKSHGLTNYIINLMAMDYGSAIASNCTLNSSGKCDMGKSAIQSAVNLHNYYGVPYSQIEITPMIGGNDATDEIFSISDAATLSSWVKANGVSGIHFWSLDRDKDCAPGYASATCNSYGSAGTWGFSNAFISDLGL
ncbi:MAG: carbohydrate-binding protein [Vitreoscilla sp.]